MVVPVSQMRVRHRERWGIASEAHNSVCLVPKHRHRGDAQETSLLLGGVPRCQPGLLPAESMWAQFLKRVLCPRPGAQRMAARAGHFPTEWPPVTSLGAIQAGLASSEGPLAAQPSSGHRAQGRAGHTPLGRCPAMLRPGSHDWGCKYRSRRGCSCLLLDVNLRHGLAQALLLCWLWHPRS